MGSKQVWSLLRNPCRLRRDAGEIDARSLQQVTYTRVQLPHLWAVAAVSSPVPCQELAVLFPPCPTVRVKKVSAPGLQHPISEDYITVDSKSEAPWG